jgi:hypothetical protein
MITFGESNADGYVPDSDVHGTSDFLSPSAGKHVVEGVVICPKCGSENELRSRHVEAVNLVPGYRPKYYCAGVANRCETCREKLL